MKMVCETNRPPTLSSSVLLQCYIVAAFMNLAGIDLRNAAIIHIKVSSYPTLDYSCMNHFMNFYSFFKRELFAHAGVSRHNVDPFKKTDLGLDIVILSGECPVRDHNSRPQIGRLLQTSRERS